MELNLPIAVTHTGTLVPPAYRYLFYVVLSFIPLILLYYQVSLDQLLFSSYPDAIWGPVFFILYFLSLFFSKTMITERFFTFKHQQSEK